MSGFGDGLPDASKRLLITSLGNELKGGDINDRSGFFDNKPAAEFL